MASTSTMKTNLVLYGFMGAGKTTVASTIAKSHGLTLRDTDEIVEAQEGATIEEIFRAMGEIYFRSIERDVVRMLSQRDGQVIATGGGVPLDASNVTALADRGVGIYLRATPVTLSHRLQGAKNRPLLGKGTSAKKIQSLLATRREFYGRVTHVIDTDRLELGQVCQKAWQLFLDSGGAASR